ncbi:hypothetical protein ESCOMM098M_09330 [Escherichia coli]
MYKKDVIDHFGTQRAVSKAALMVIGQGVRRAA